MEVGKEPGDVVDGAGGDGLSKGGPKMVELHAGAEEESSVDGVKSHLEVTKESDNDEKIRERLESTVDEHGDDGKKNSDNVEQKEEVAGAAVEGNVSKNVEERVEVIGEGLEVQQLEVHAGDEEILSSKVLYSGQGIQNSQILEGREDIQKSGKHQSDRIRQFVLSHASEEIQNLAAHDGKEVQQAETSDVNGVQELKEHNAIGEFQQPEKPDVKEVIDNQDADIQIDDTAVGMTEHPNGENMEYEPADPSSAVNEKEDHTECLEMPIAAKCQAEAAVHEGSVNSVFGAGVTASSTIVENDGDKLDVLSVVDFDTEVLPDNGMSQMEWAMSNEKGDETKEHNLETHEKGLQIVETAKPEVIEEKLNSSLYLEGDESGTEEEQVLFFREVETFFKSRGTDFKPPKFYGEPLNLLKLWRAVIRLGGYEQVTSCKLWRQIGESFNPPKTCTTVSWTFRLFYEKALLEFEKHKMRDGDLPYDSSFTEFDTETQSGGSQGPGSGRVRRDSAARAMQGWHSQRALSNGEIGDPIIKDKSSGSTQKREKHGKSNDIAPLKRKTTSSYEHPSKLARTKSPRPQMEISVVDAGEPAEWVKINVRKTKDCFEIYALVPGLLREEVRVQSDPAGRLVISGEPERLDNPWGVTPFKKVVSLPSRIDPHQTSAVVTLHGQLFVRVPFEQSDG
ncbi:hypothetical protein QQ045_006361 [Rhodiola kirilowii]